MPVTLPSLFTQPRYVAEAAADDVSVLDWWADLGQGSGPASKVAEEVADAALSVLWGKGQAWVEARAQGFAEDAIAVLTETRYHLDVLKPAIGDPRLPQVTSIWWSAQNAAWYGRMSTLAQAYRSADAAGTRLSGRAAFGGWVWPVALVGITAIGAVAVVIVSNNALEALRILRDFSSEAVAAGYPPPLSLDSGAIADAISDAAQASAAGTRNLMLLALLAVGGAVYFNERGVRARS